MEEAATFEITGGVASFTVMVLLVANRTNPSSAKKRTWYCPGGAVAGITSCTVPPVPPPRYFQTTEPVSGPPTATSPTQSFGFPGPFATTTVIVSPTRTVVGDTVTVGVGAASSFTMVPVPCAVPSAALVG